MPQQLAIKDDLQTLCNLHQLCGSINWVRPLLGITTEDLALLFNLLRGSGDLDSPRSITLEDKRAIEKVQEAFSSQQAHCADPQMPFQLVVLSKSPNLHALIVQWDTTQRDSLLVTE